MVMRLIRGGETFVPKRRRPGKTLHELFEEAKRPLRPDESVYLDRGFEIPYLPDHGERMRKSGGPYIGPRGGKWANPERTIPWKPPGKARPVASAELASLVREEKLDGIVGRPGGFPATPENIAAVEDEIRARPTESGFAFGGDDFFWYRRGNKMFISILAEERERMTKAGSVVFTHNHPGGGFLSPQDVAAAINLNMVEMRATSEHGTFWLRRPPQGWDRTVKEYRPYPPPDVKSHFYENLEDYSSAARDEMQEYLGPERDAEVKALERRNEVGLNPAERTYFDALIAKHAIAYLPELQRALGDSAEVGYTPRETTKKALLAKGSLRTGFVGDIEAMAVKNSDFRRVLYTVKHCQLVLMALRAGEQIGSESHPVDQFFRVEEGTGEVTLAGKKHKIKAGTAIVVPAGTRHNITSSDTAPLRLYTLYAPPHHRDKTVHHTRKEARTDTEHFDGKVTKGDEVIVEIHGGFFPMASAKGLYLVFPVDEPGWIFPERSAASSEDDSPPHLTFLYIGHPLRYDGVAIPLDTITTCIRHCLARLPRTRMQLGTTLEQFLRVGEPDVYYMPVEVPEQALFENVRCELVQKLRAIGLDIADQDPLRWTPHVTWSYGQPRRLPWARPISIDSSRIELWGGDEPVVFRARGCKITKAGSPLGSVVRWSDGGYRKNGPSGWVPAMHHDGSWYSLSQSGKWKPDAHLDIMYPKGPPDLPEPKLPLQDEPNLPRTRRPETVMGFEIPVTRTADPLRELKLKEGLAPLRRIEQEPNGVDDIRLANKLGRRDIGYLHLTSWEAGPVTKDGQDAVAFWASRLNAAGKRAGLHVHLGDLRGTDPKLVASFVKGCAASRAKPTLSYTGKDRAALALLFAYVKRGDGGYPVG